MNINQGLYDSSTGLLSVFFIVELRNERVLIEDLYLWIKVAQDAYCVCNTNTTNWGGKHF